VLPLVNLSPDPANEYFADGLTEDLTDWLARSGAIQVVSRTSAFLFKGKHSDVREIGAKLNAAYAVEGSVRKDSGRVKVTAQLVRTSDGYHLWSNSFERDGNDIFAVQSEIAQSVVSALSQKLSIPSPQTMPPRTRSAKAFDLYMQGRHAAGNGILLDYAPAEALFRHAISADPAYALPYLGLAELYRSAEILQLHPAQELISMVKGSLTKALELAPDLAEAHVIQAAISARHEYDWPSAEKHIQRALALAGNTASAHHARAVHLFMLQGRWQEAVSEMRLAEELDPFSPAMRIGAPWILCMQRRFDECLAATAMLSRGASPDPALAILLATARAGKRDFDGAIAALRVLGPAPMSSAMIATYHAAAGRSAEAHRLLKDTTAEARRRFVPPSVLAIHHMAVGDYDRAFEFLGRAPSSQESFVAFARVAPWFDPLRNDPRFRQLLAAVRLTDEEVTQFQQVTPSVHR